MTLLEALEIVYVLGAENSIDKYAINTLEEIKEEKKQEQAFDIVSQLIEIFKL